MSKDLNKAGPTVHVADIVHHGDKMILPEKMGLDAAIDLLTRRKQYLTEQVRLVEMFNAFPWDGAHALDLAMSKLYGWTQQAATESFFGKVPPQLISIDIGPNKRKKVPWGKFMLPSVKGELHSGVANKDGVLQFQLSAVVTRADELEVQKLFDMVRAELEANSIYRGKAIRIKFFDEAGDINPLPNPTFIDTSLIDPDMLVYSEDVRAAIETNLFTPIIRAKDCLENKIPLKRGILLGGRYGTGKTLAANVAAKHAVDNGITYLYIPSTKELPHAIHFARQYQSPACVVFCEDVDRITSGTRDAAMDEVLNTIDGIDSKSANVIVVLTTNHIEDINDAMLRPGRLDAVIEVTPPDATAVVELLKKYGGSSIDPKADLEAVGKQLDGQIPAVIAEVVKRAKLSQLKYTDPGKKVRMISAQALLDAAKTMSMQLKLLSREKKVPEPTLDQRIYAIVQKVNDGAPLQ